jgi:hypothetical protein
MQLQPFEGLRARHFMQQMTVDIEDRGAVLFRVDDVRVPQLVVESLGHGERFSDDCGVTLLRFVGSLLDDYATFARRVGTRLGQKSY